MNGEEQQEIAPISAVANRSPVPDRVPYYRGETFRRELTKITDARLYKARRDSLSDELVYGIFFNPKKVHKDNTRYFAYDKETRKWKDESKLAQDYRAAHVHLDLESESESEAEAEGKRVGDEESEEDVIENGTLSGKDGTLSSEDESENSEDESENDDGAVDGDGENGSGSVIKKAGAEIEPKSNPDIAVQKFYQSCFSYSPSQQCFKETLKPSPLDMDDCPIYEGAKQFKSENDLQSKRAPPIYPQRFSFGNIRIAGWPDYLMPEQLSAGRDIIDSQQTAASAPDSSESEAQVDDSASDSWSINDLANIFGSPVGKADFTLPDEPIEDVSEFSYFAAAASIPDQQVSEYKSASSDEISDIIQDIMNNTIVKVSDSSSGNAETWPTEEVTDVQDFDIETLGMGSLVSMDEQASETVVPENKAEVTDFTAANYFSSADLFGFLKGGEVEKEASGFGVEDEDNHVKALIESFESRLSETRSAASPPSNGISNAKMWPLEHPESLRDFVYEESVSGVNFRIYSDPPHFQSSLDGYNNEHEVNLNSIFVAEILENFDEEIEAKPSSSSETRRLTAIVIESEAKVESGEDNYDGDVEENAENRHHSEPQDAGYEGEDFKILHENATGSFFAEEAIEVVGIEAEIIEPKVIGGIEAETFKHEIVEPGAAQPRVPRVAVEHENVIPKAIDPESEAVDTDHEALVFDHEDVAVGHDIFDYASLPEAVDNVVAEHEAVNLGNEALAIDSEAVSAEREIEAHTSAPTEAVNLENEALVVDAEPESAERGSIARAVAEAINIENEASHSSARENDVLAVDPEAVSVEREIAEHAALVVDAEPESAEHEFIASEAVVVEHEVVYPDAVEPGSAGTNVNADGIRSGSVGNVDDFDGPTLLSANSELTASAGDASASDDGDDGDIDDSAEDDENDSADGSDKDGDDEDFFALNKSKSQKYADAENDSSDVNELNVPSGNAPKSGINLVNIFNFGFITSSSSSSSSSSDSSTSDSSNSQSTSSTESSSSGAKRSPVAMRYPAPPAKKKTDVKKQRSAVSHRNPLQSNYFEILKSGDSPALSSTKFEVKSETNYGDLGFVCGILGISALSIVAMCFIIKKAFRKRTDGIEGDLN